MSLGLVISICIPDSCTIGDAGSVAQVLFPDLIEQSESLSIPGYCYEELPWTGGDIAAIVILSFFALCAFLGTMYDVLMRKQGRKPDGKIGTILLCFSWLKNGEKLFSTKTSSDQLSCLNGLRTLSMFWVILGHTFAQGLFYSQNIFSITTDTFEFQSILNGDLAVDTFFLLSGLLVGYLTLKALAKNNSLKFWGLFYFHRIWRLTPVYMLCLMFYTTLFFHLLRGPMATSFTDYFKTPCTNYWWTNLLYINNFHPGGGNTDFACMNWSWYLANDLQFYILSPVLLLLLRYYWKTGMAVCTFLIGACVVTTGVLAKIYGIYHIFDPRDSDLKEGAEDLDSDMYVRPYFRFMPYVMGLMLGGIFIRRKDIKLNWLASGIGWILAIGCGLSVVYGYLPIIQDLVAGTAINVDVAIFYFAMRRFSFSIAIAWLVFACITGNGGPINWFLSWRIWIPLGRLAYCTYLIHPMVIFTYCVNLKVFFNMDTENIIYLFMSFSTLSCLVAAVVSLTLESPFMALEKVMLGGTGGQVNKQQQPTGGKLETTDAQVPSYVNGGYQSNGIRIHNPHVEADIKGTKEISGFQSTLYPPDEDGKIAIYM